MRSKLSSFWILYCVLAALILLRLLVFVIGFDPLWGSSPLLFLPIGYVIGYCLLGAIALTLPLISIAPQWGAILAERMNSVCSANKAGLTARIGLIAGCGLLFWLFSMPTHFLGDGYPYLANLGSAAGNWVKWSEGGAMQAVLALQLVFGKTSEDSAELAFRVLSVGSGVVALWFFVLIARVISDDSTKRFLTFVALVLTPSLLLFFGYVESYPLMWGPIAGFFYFALLYINSGNGMTGAVVCLLLATVAHLQALLFYPSLLYLIFSRGKGLELFKRFKFIAFTIGILALIAFGVVFYRAYTSDLYFQNLFLWPFTGKPSAPTYAIISVSHLLDIINELLLVSPILPILFVLSWSGLKNMLRNKTTTWLAVTTIPALIFLFVFDPSLSLPRDWDLFAICILPITLLTISIIPKRNLAVATLFLAPVAIAATIFTLPSLMVNLDRDRSINQIKSIINAFPDKSMGTIAILGRQYHGEGDRARSDSCENRMQELYPRLYQMRKARQALSFRDLRSADTYFRMINPDPYWKDCHLYLAERFMLTNQLDSALVHAESAIQLQKYNQPSYLTLALTRMARNELSKALDALRFGLSLNNRAPLFLLNLAMVHSWQNTQDSVFIYAKKLYEIDTTSELGRSLLARGYFYQRDNPNALLHARRYMEMGYGTEEYEILSGELIQLMPELEDYKQQVSAAHNQQKATPTGVEPVLPP